MPGCFWQIVKNSVNFCPIALPKYCSEPAACLSLHHGRQRLLFGLFCVPGANCMLVRILSMPGQRAFSTARSSGWQPLTLASSWLYNFPFLTYGKKSYKDIKIYFYCILCTSILYTKWIGYSQDTFSYKWQTWNIIGLIKIRNFKAHESLKQEATESHNWKTHSV